MAGAQVRLMTKAADKNIDLIISQRNIAHCALAVTACSNLSLFVFGMVVAWVVAPQLSLGEKNASVVAPNLLLGKIQQTLHSTGSQTIIILLLGTSLIKPAEGWKF